MLNRINIAVLLVITLLYPCEAQNIPELQRFSDTTLFNPVDTACFDVNGEWTGEEVQFDPTQSFIKFKFKIVLKLEQEGNRVYGTSYIQDKYRGSYGDMKIRGMVVGNKLHFEEYEIMSEKIYEQNVVWCLRSGELTIKADANSDLLEGLSYAGYASDTYSQCTDYAKMSATRLIRPQKRHNYNELTSPKAVINGNYTGSVKMLIYPNPAVDLTTISYQLKRDSKVKIDIFTLSGAYEETIFDGFQSSGSQSVQVNLSAYIPGVYLARLNTGHSYSTGQVVKAK